MATGNWNQNNSGSSFRPRSGNNYHPRPSGTRQNSNSNNRMNNTNYYQREQQYESSSNIHYGSQQRSNHSSASRSTAKDDETRAYAVNLQLKPVEMGIRATNGAWKQEFRGLGAFNHYLGLCAPTHGLGYSLPDIWDGYFHITLAKFFSRLSADMLEKIFKEFNPALEDIPYIPKVVFRASRLGRYSGENRGGNRKDIDFIVLAIDSTPETKIFYDKIQSLLEKIEDHAQTTDWDLTPLDKLHVTVRKYSNIDFSLEKIKVQQFPLEFQCSHLEIKQPREQAMGRFKRAQNNMFPWWEGVTEINKKCSGCGVAVMSDVWEGFCLACGKYESVIPLWSTIGNNISNHSLQQEQTQNKMLCEGIQQVSLNEL